jgi:hypothetical protein
MFRILCDPSSGSTELCLTEITGSDSQIFCRVLVSVFGSVILNLWCVCTVRPAGPYTHTPHNVDFNL